MPDILTVGREAIRRHDWGAALEALVESDRDDALSADDLVMLGDAYWWTAQPDAAVNTFERAFGAFVDADRPEDAAVVGTLLAYFSVRRHNQSIAGAWVTRVERLLEGKPPSPAHAWLNLIYSAFALFAGVDMDDVVQKTDETIRLAKEMKMPGVESLALSFKGLGLIQKGEWREGVALIDEATVVAMSEGADLRATSDVYCNTIAACASLGDFGRAGEWTEEAERWMDANAVGGYTGICKVHRAELKRMKGSWSEAEETARQACIELERFRIMDGIGFARYEIGEVRRRMGDLDSAEEAFQQAYEYGHDAQPGYSLLLLDRGDVAGAANSISEALSSGKESGHTSARLSRARLLPAQVEIALAAEDLKTAHAALDELKTVAEDYDSAVWTGYALACEGSVELAEGNVEKALDILNRSWLTWRDSDMPYEAAQARILLGMARRASGDDAGATREFRAARSTLEKLGAIRDLEKLAEITGETSSSDTPGARVTRSFMFTDIVTSTDLIGLIGDSAWEDLLKWHDRTLREEFAAHSGDEVRHTGDGFFIAFAQPRSAVECAVAIQRRLEKHRREHGFSPWVRIGIHHSEASLEKSDYAGQGVHIAARLGDLADKAQILVSEDFLDAAGAIPFAVSEPRRVALKGVAGEVRVREIDWR